MKEEQPYAWQCPECQRWTAFTDAERFVGSFECCTREFKAQLARVKKANALGPFLENARGWGQWAHHQVHRKFGQGVIE